MAVTHRTLAILDQIRLDLDRRVGVEDRRIVEAWERAWAELRPAWAAAIDRLILIQQQGRKPTRREVSEALRATRAMAATQDAIIALAREQGIRITATLPDLTKAAKRLEADLLASTLPPNIPAGHALAGATFDRLDPKALDAIVRRTAGQVAALTWPLSAEATAAMKSILIRGVALGMHPNAAAALMLSRVGAAFDGGRARAVNIARTEMLDAHRAATAAQDKASRDLLTGWQWVATLTSRTCSSCWAMHGTEHAIDEPGPIDHQQGRCTRVPLTKSWRDLGLDIDEPSSVVPDGYATFRALSRDDQLAVLGRDKLDLLDSGRISWSDLATRRSTDGWRDSMVPTSLADLRAIAARRAA